MYNKDILYKMMVLLGEKYLSNRKEYKKEYYNTPQFCHAKELFDNKKYFEAYCYVLANIDNFNNVDIHNKETNKIIKRILELKEKIYTPEEIASIVSKEFSKR